MYHRGLREGLANAISEAVPSAARARLVKNEEQRDQFGLPKHWTFLEDDEQFNERMVATEAFVGVAVKAVLRQVDRKVARQMFLKALKPLTPGRQADEKANARLLEGYDRAIARGILPKHAARAAAKEIKIGDVEATAKHIRTLVKQRLKAARRAQAEANWLRKFPPSFLDEGELDSDL